MPLKDALQELTRKLPLFESVSDRDSFLKETVRMMAKAMGVNMAAVFIHDAEAGDLVFRAGVDDEGLWDRANCPLREEDGSPKRFNLDGNDVGRAFTEGRVIRHSYDLSADHPFKTKLIVPIARGPLKSGVLVLGSNKADAFTGIKEGEILSAISRLGDLLEDASYLIRSKKKRNSSMGREILGKKAGSGQAAGTALPFWNNAADGASVPFRGTVDENLTLFDRALEQSLEQLEVIRAKAETEVSETGAMIFMAQILMLRDDSFTGAMRQQIESGTSAVAAIQGVVDDYAGRFSAMEEQRLAEKAQDVRDLGYRLINALSDDGDSAFSYQGRIALARHIYPSDLFRLSLEGVSGVVLMGAAVTAHISILAKSLGLPVLITDDKSLLDVRSGTRLILDADKGRLIIDPPEPKFEAFKQGIGGRTAIPKAYTLRGRTSDGTKVAVLANVNILKDAEDAKEQGAEGIGLYRSEFPFILKNDILSEEQQYQVYRSVADTQGDKPIIFRTADIGGDKILQGREQPEDNPFLGVRGIRFSLAHPSMFRDQLKAMLRAGAGKDLGIMFPMVSGVEEILEAKEELERCKEELQLRDVPFNESPRIGAMVELPSAALAVEELAAETDFLSIGTNDLTMYLLAVDRTNENLSHLYRSHHPTVLRTLAAIAKGAEAHGTDLSVCGDAAADPTLTPFFLGIGIRKLSVPPTEVESLKQLLASWSVEKARKIADEMLAIGRVSEMETYLENFDSGAPAA